jgi:hypothetical protein
MDVQQDYRAVGYPGDPSPPPGQIGPRRLPVEAAPFFEEVACLRYPFQIRYSAEDYLANLATQSGTRALGPARRADFSPGRGTGSARWARLTSPRPSWGT